MGASGVPVLRALIRLVCVLSVLLVAVPAFAAFAVTRGNPTHVDLTTNVLAITVSSGAEWISIQNGEVDVYIVTGPFTDGAALPANGWWLVPADATASYYIGAAGQIGLAGSGAGEVNVLFR